MAAPRRWLIRFGYDGGGFAGWARQPGARTVEGEVREGIERCGIAESAEAAGLSIASRTDRGVSARANALTLSSPLPGAALLRALNGISPEIVFRAATPVSAGFDPRHAAGRWYRYFQSGEGRSLRTWRQHLPLLTGRLDVRSFGRGLPADRPTWRDVDLLSVTSRGRWLIVDIRARSFVWGMVRKIVATLRGLEDGTIGAEEVRRAARGERRLTVPLAEPEPLVLWEVRYPVRWQYRSPGPTRHQARYGGAEIARAEVRSRILAELYG